MILIIILINHHHHYHSYWSSTSCSFVITCSSYNVRLTTIFGILFTSLALCWLCVYSCTLLELLRSFCWCSPLFQRCFLFQRLPAPGAAAALYKNINICLTYEGVVAGRGERACFALLISPGWGSCHTLHTLSKLTPALATYKALTAHYVWTFCDSTCVRSACCPCRSVRSSFLPLLPAPNYYSGFI